MANISQFSTAAASNNDPSPDGAPEGMAPSGVNDTIRENMAALARWYSDTDGTLVTTGSANVYALTTNNAHAALADQSMIILRANVTNTGASTLNVDTLGAKAIKINHDEDVASGDIEANGIYIAVYNANDDVYQFFGISVPADGSITTAKLANSSVTEEKISTFPLPRNFLSGLNTSNGTDTDHDIDIAAGECRDTTNTANLSFSAPHTKRIDASWVSGSGNGGLASAVSLTANTTYHLCAVDDGAGNTEAGFDTSLTAANLLSDTGGSQYRRIWSVITDASNNIIPYTQEGDENYFNTIPVLDYDALAGSSLVTTAVTTPNGITVLARLNVFVGDDTVYFSHPNATDQTPVQNAAPLQSIGEASGGTATSIGGTVSVFTDTSSQITHRGVSGTATRRIATVGWNDTRGRND